MREPTIVNGPMFSPGFCHVCGRVEGKMVDTGVDVPGDGRTYICVDLCLPLMANRAGFLTPEQANRLGAEVGTLNAQVAELREELEFERDHKLLTVSDALALADRRAEYAGERVHEDDGA
jgi:hypothetical protein